MVRIFRGKEGLQALEADWRMLEQRLPDPRFVHCYGWFRSHLAIADASPESAVFLLVSEAENPIAIFPLHRTVTRRFGIPLRTLEILWPNDMGVCDVLLEKRESNRGLLELVVRSLSAHEGLSWDLLRLQDTPVDSNLLYTLAASRLPLSLSILHHQSKFICCDAGYESVMKRLTGHFRRNVRRQARKADEHGHLEFRFVSDAAGLNDAFDQFLQAEESGWKGKTGTGSAIRLHRDQVAFYRVLMDEFAQNHACSINLAILNGSCIASQFCLIVGDTLYLLKIGYSEKHRSIGPGNVLLNELIRRCCAEKRVRKISFVTGADWNDRWSPDALDVYESCAFNFTLPGLVVYFLEKIKNFGRGLKRRGLRVLQARPDRNAA